MKVLWTDSAVAQLQAIHDYLAQTSPEFALRIVDRLTKRSIQIAAFPLSGRMVPEYELNEVRETHRGAVSNYIFARGRASTGARCYSWSARRAPAFRVSMWSRANPTSA